MISLKGCLHRIKIQRFQIYHLLVKLNNFGFTLSSPLLPAYLGHNFR